MVGKINANKRPSDLLSRGSILNNSKVDQTIAQFRLRSLQLCLVQLFITPHATEVAGVVNRDFF